MPSSTARRRRRSWRPTSGRCRVFFIVDEAQELVASQAVVGIFDQIRHRDISLILAHQYDGQMKKRGPDYSAGLETNVSWKIDFSLPTPEAMERAQKYAPDDLRPALGYTVEPGLFFDRDEEGALSLARAMASRPRGEGDGEVGAPLHQEHDHRVSTAPDASAGSAPATTRGDAAERHRAVHLAAPDEPAGMGRLRDRPGTHLLAARGGDRRGAAGDRLRRAGGQRGGRGANPAAQREAADRAVAEKIARLGGGS